MNCKPGDLAIIVRGNGKARMFIGHVVTTVCLHDEFEDTWLVDPPKSLDGRNVVFHDGVLRPIRDPGEDAQDETLNWPPVPSRDEVMA